MRTDGDSGPGRLLWPLFFVLVALSAYVMLSGASRDASSPQSTDSRDASSASETGDTSAETSGHTEPVGPDAGSTGTPSTGPTPSDGDAPRADLWRLTFAVEGAPRWQDAVFVPVTGDAPIRATNVEAGPAHGALDVYGDGTLFVRAAMYLPWTSGALARPSTGAMTLTAVLAEGRVVTGSVVAADGTTPVAKGMVRVTSAPRSEALAALPQDVWTFTDAQGQFRIAGLPEGEITLSARPYERELGRTTQVQTVSGSRVEIRLDPIGWVRLHLTDVLTGEGPRSAVIRVHHTDPEGKDDVSLTLRHMDNDEPAVIDIRNVRLGSETTLRIQADGYDPVDTRVSLPATGGSKDIILRLHPTTEEGATLTVHMKFVGAPAPDGVLVSRITGDQSVALYQPLQDGSIKLFLPHGVHRVMIAPPHSSAFWLPITLAFNEEATRTGRKLEQQATLVQGGHVELGGQLAGATTMTLSHARASLQRIIRARNGRTAVYAIPPGTWDFEVEGPHDMWRGTVQIHPGNTVRPTWSVVPKARPAVSMPGAVPLEPK